VKDATDQDLLVVRPRFALDDRSEGERLVKGEAVGSGGRAHVRRVLSGKRGQQHVAESSGGRIVGQLVSARIKVAFQRGAGGLAGQEVVGGQAGIRADGRQKVRPPESDRGVVDDGCDLLRPPAGTDADCAMRVALRRARAAAATRHAHRLAGWCVLRRAGRQVKRLPDLEQVGNQAVDLPQIVGGDGRPGNTRPQNVGK